MYTQYRKFQLEIQLEVDWLAFVSAADNAGDNGYDDSSEENKDVTMRMMILLVIKPLPLSELRLEFPPVVVYVGG